MKASVTNEAIIGDSLDLNVEYINVSDSPVIFYPLGLISIAKPIEFFDGDAARSINLVQDYRRFVIIERDQKYIAHYRIKISPPFFKVGITEFSMSYHIAYEKEFNKGLCGRLESNLLKVLARNSSKN